MHSLQTSPLYISRRLPMLVFHNNLARFEFDELWRVATQKTSVGRFKTTEVWMHHNTILHILLFCICMSSRLYAVTHLLGWASGLVLQLLSFLIDLNGFARNSRSWTQICWYKRVGKNLIYFRMQKFELLYILGDTQIFFFFFCTDVRLEISTTTQ